MDFPPVSNTFWQAFAEQREIFFCLVVLVWGHTDLFLTSFYLLVTLVLAGQQRVSETGLLQLFYPPLCLPGWFHPTYRRVHLDDVLHFETAWKAP